MTHQEIAEVFTKYAFNNISEIEDYFQKLGFNCEIDCCQWDDISYVFTSPDTNAFFTVHIDPYLFSFIIYIWKNEDEDYCDISYKIGIERGEMTIYE